MAKIRVYMACSIDGFIADDAGGVDWLNPYNSPELGFMEFVAQVGTVVSGRKTYEQSLSFGGHGGGTRTIVLTSRPLDKPRKGVETHAGDVAPLLAGLRAEKKDVWILGGADVVGQFLAAKGVDELELYVVPVVLGAGVPISRGFRGPGTFRLAETRTFDNGIVKLLYRQA